MTPSLQIGNGKWAVKSGNELGYKIINNKYYPREMTVTRATTGTRVNADGLVELVPYNLFRYSEEFNNAAWVKGNSPTITNNIAIAPDGTLTADGIQDTTGGAYKTIHQLLSPIAPNLTHTFSIYVKKETSEINYGGFAVYYTAGTAKIFNGIFNAVNGTVTEASSTMPATINVLDSGDYWRITCTTTDTGSNNILRCYYYGTMSTNGTTIGVGVGSVRTIWGAQLVEGTEAKDYLPTTDRLNIPRVDYSTGEAALLIEPQRTNLFTYSESTNNFSTFGQSNTAYSSGNGFNGFKSSCKITFSTFTNSFPRAVLIYNAISGQNNYFTLHFKKKSGFYVKINFGNATSNFTIGLNLETGELISTSGTAVGNTKVLIIGEDTYQVGFLTSANSTTAAGLLNIDFFNNSSFSNWTNSNASDFALISGIQWENQVTYGTSYIPTTSASVTRNADVVTKTNASAYIGQTEGTVFFEGNVLNLSQARRFIVLYQDANNYITLRITSGNDLQFLIVSSGATSVNILTANIEGNIKMALAYSNNDFVAYLNGTQVGSDTSGSVPATSDFYLGCDQSGINQMAGLIKSVSIYKERLTDDELQTLTGGVFTTYAMMAQNLNYILQ